MGREEDRQEALRRIQQEAEKKTGRLDLSELIDLDKLPSELSELTHVTELNCRDTSIADLSPVASLSALRTLFCWSTQIADLSPLTSLSALRSLNCWNTRIADLSPLGSLSALRYLNCSHTQVIDLSPLASLSALQSFTCWRTRVVDLSPLGSLSALQSLHFSHTQVSDLSPLASISSLRSLFCSHTRVESLSPLTSHLALQSLNCSYTKVTDIAALSDLRHLERLYIRGLQLSHIPELLLVSKALGKLDFRGGRLDGVPAELLGDINCIEALRSHFRDLAEGEEDLPDVKVIVLGNGRIGKTQLCGQLKGEPYEKGAESTHGILVSSAKLGMDRLHLWDFGGQELYHGTHALFMRTRAVFVVLWTPDSENQQEHEWQGMTFRNHRLEYWLELVAALGGENSPLLAVQGRCDTSEDELVMPPVEAELLQRFRFRKVLHQSSAVPRGLESLKIAITDAISWMREKQGAVRIGAGRLRVKRRLESLRDTDAALPVTDRQHRLVSQAFYRAICEDEGGVSEPDQLLSYLHECGVVFHRRGLFGDQIILDQGWALEAIYTVFNREKCWRQIRSLNGRFTRALLEALAWQRHSVEEQKLFLSMMQSCGICFVHRELEDGEKEYIAPDLLPPEEELSDTLAVRWGEDGADQSWTYEIPHEHPGLMTAVISTVGAAAGIDAIYWKGGFCGYEKNTGSRVRVRDVSQGKELRIELETKGGDARSLIKEIHSSLEEIFYHVGCFQWTRERENETVLQMKKGKANFILEKENEAQVPVALEFAEPPRTTTTYAVSYAWTEESSALVDRLCTDAGKRGLKILRDCNAVGLGEELTRFMRHLAAQDRVFVILSKNYLESPNCMFELLEIWRQSKQEKEEFLAKVRCFLMDDLQIRTVVQRAEWSAHWLKEINQLDGLVEIHGAKVLGETGARDYMQMQQFSLYVTDILAHVNDVLRPRTLEELERHGFSGEA